MQISIKMKSADCRIELTLHPLGVYVETKASRSHGVKWCAGYRSLDGCDHVTPPLFFHFAARSRSRGISMSALVPAGLIHPVDPLNTPPMDFISSGIRRNRIRFFVDPPAANSWKFFESPELKSAHLIRYQVRIS